MLRPLLSLVLLLALSPVSLAVDTPIPTAPVVDAKSYIVVDYRTDKILAAQDAVARMEPASLTKLMTA
jgi:D-alanyl-D-alanine carboxypeptidase (penicillin-binding protein 5/6)